MPIIKIEICWMERNDLPRDLATRAQETFVAAFSADIKYVDARVAATPWGEFVGYYEKGDEPVWVEATMT